MTRLVVPCLVLSYMRRGGGGGGGGRLDRHRQPSPLALNGHAIVMSWRLAWACVPQVARLDSAKRASCWAPSMAANCLGWVVRGCGNGARRGAEDADAGKPGNFSRKGTSQGTNAAEGWQGIH